MTGYEISDVSTCEAIIHESKLQFKLVNVVEYDIENIKDPRGERNVSVLIDLDEGSEEILSQVFSWVTIISQLVELGAMREKHSALIHSLWP